MCKKGWKALCEWFCRTLGKLALNEEYSWYRHCSGLSIQEDFFGDLRFSVAHCVFRGAHVLLYAFWIGGGGWGFDRWVGKCLLIVSIELIIGLFLLDINMGESRL